MKKLFYKELKLSASVLSYFFIAAALLTFVPGYPILLGAFFTTLGIFYSYQSMRENNDIYYSLLLPVSKRDVVKSKYAFTAFIELCAFAVMAVITLVRMTLLKNAAVYVSNALMCANFTFLGFALLIFGVFNFVFVKGFFRTAYYFGRPFIAYCAIVLVLIAAAETLHHIPGLEKLNAFGFDPALPQLGVFIAGAIMFVLLTFFGEKRSEKLFEAADM